MSENEESDYREEVESLGRVGFDVQGEVERSGSFLIVDDKEEESTSGEESLVMLPMSFAIEEYPWVKDMLFSIVPRDKDRWTEMVGDNDKLLGSFIYVKEGKKIRAPAQSCFFLHNEGFEQILHNIIYLEEGSHIDIITGCATGNLVTGGKHVAVTEAFIKKGASLTYTMIHDWGTETVVYPRTAIDVEEGGNYISNYVALTAVKRIEAYPVAYLAGNSKARFSSVIYGRPGSFIDMGARTILRGERSGSEIISRVVAEKSRVISRGYIEGKNSETRGHMECNGLLLDDESSIYTIPELEASDIDTQLSHEASVGKIAGEQLNYLMSRGMNEEKARALIIRGFLEKGITGLPDALQSKIDLMIEKATSKESI